jgi:hypothetical protein
VISAGAVVRVALEEAAKEVRPGIDRRRIENRCRGIRMVSGDGDSGEAFERPKRRAGIIDHLGKRRFPLARAARASNAAAARIDLAFAQHSLAGECPAARRSRQRRSGTGFRSPPGCRRRRPVFPAHLARFPLQK